MKKNNHFTVMVIPEENGKTFTFRLPKIAIGIFVFFLICFLVSFLVLIVKSAEIVSKLQMLSVVKNENDKLLNENEELRAILDKMNELSQFSEYLYNLAIPSNIRETYMGSEINDSNKIIDTNTIDENSKNFVENSENKLYSENIDKYPNIVPVSGWITRHFKKDTVSNNQDHLGVDFAAAKGTPIKTTADGIVISIENDKYMGLMVTIDHNGGIKTRYGHCSQILVTLHDHVKKGQTIALVGNTGRSSAPHLHYEVLKDEYNVNPLSYIIEHRD